MGTTWRGLLGQGWSGEAGVESCEREEVVAAWGAGRQEVGAAPPHPPTPC